MPEEIKPTKSNATLIILIVIGIIIVAGIAVFFVYRYYQAKKVDQTVEEILANPDAFKNGTTKTTTPKSTGKIDSNLVGNWDTGCLVPDPNSPWAEQHTFKIESNGNATHTRSTGDTCAGLKQDHFEEYQISIPSANQINLIAKTANEPSIYDIYAVSGNTLKFGHGFCNCSKLCSASGGSTEGDRISCLNDFLVYKK